VPSYWHFANCCCSPLDVIWEKISNQVPHVCLKFVIAATFIGEQKSFQEGTSGFPEVNNIVNEDCNKMNLFGYWLINYVSVIILLFHVENVVEFTLFLQDVTSDVAVVHPTVEPPPPYTPVSSWQANAAAAAEANEELQRRQEELERKAAELQRREDELQRNMQYQGLLDCLQ